MTSLSQSSNTKLGSKRLRRLLDQAHLSSSRKVETKQSKDIQYLRQSIDDMGKKYSNELGLIRTNNIKPIPSTKVGKSHTYDNSVTILSNTILELRNEISTLKNQVESILVEIPIAIPSSDMDGADYLHIGKAFNIPEQPYVVKEGGVHKVAPLALSINGALVLHDIGYTSEKKGLIPIYFDPITERLLIYNGK